MVKLNSIKVHSRENLEKRLNFLSTSYNGIHSALRLTLLSVRLVGLLPLNGLWNKNSSYLVFTLKNPFYIVFFLFSISGQVFMAVLNVIHLIIGETTLVKVTNTVFYMSSLVITVLSMKIGFYWHSFVHKVELIESKLPPLSSKVVSNCNTAVILVVFTATVEHIASLWYELKVSGLCDPDKTLETYFTHNMPWIFDYFTYSPWTGLLGSIFNIQSTFMWSFNDLLIMVVSIYVSEHFQIHNDILKKMFVKKIYDMSMLRIQHMKLLSLVHTVNEEMGVLVLTSFAANTFWICVQLFHSLNKNNMTGTGHLNSCSGRQYDNSYYQLEHAFYFCYSFSFLAVRTAVVSLLAARIRTVSVKPLRFLYEVPMASYNLEVQRYIDQVKYSIVALSGLDFFNVTRRMILTLLGTIVTFELVLLQYGLNSSSEPGTC